MTATSTFVLSLPRWDVPNHRGRRPVWDPLWMNAREAHWGPRQKATRVVIDEVVAAARAAGLADVDDAEHLTVQLVWVPGRNTVSDAHNMNRLVKAMVDGLARGRSKAPGLHLVADDRDELVTVRPCRIVRPRDTGNAPAWCGDGLVGLFLEVVVRHRRTDEALRGSLRPTGARPSPHPSEPGDRPAVADVSGEPGPMISNAPPLEEAS